MSIAPTGMRILTNHWGQHASPSWRAATTLVPPRGNGLLASLKLALTLISKQSGFDCVVVGAGRSDLIFALLRSLAPARHIPCIMIDCLWSKDANVFKRAMKRPFFKIMDRSVNRYVVWALCEQDTFSEAFDLPRGKFVFIPYHTTGDVHTYQSADGDYVFSGGNSNRDYDTLVEAARGLPVKVIIASTIPRNNLRNPLPENVEMRGMSHREYMEKLAGCRMNVVALERSRLRAAGQQTFLNSMALGKPTIVTDVTGPLGYIEDGEDGLLVPPEDPGALRSAIERLLKDPVKARAMGAKALAKAEKFSTEEHFKKIIRLAAELTRNNEEGVGVPRGSR